jgi:hypothetical protein
MDNWYFTTCGISVYANGNSDIDLAVIPSYIKLEIQEELENLPTLYKIDFIDFNEVDDDFKKSSKVVYRVFMLMKLEKLTLEKILLKLELEEK